MHRSLSRFHLVRSASRFEKISPRGLKHNTMKEKHLSTKDTRTAPPDDEKHAFGSEAHNSPTRATHKPSKGTRMKINVRRKGSAYEAYQNILDKASFGNILRQKTVDLLKNHQDFKLQSQLENIAHHARVYADVTRNYAKDNVGSKRLFTAGCAFLALLYYYFQSAKSRALYRCLEKSRVADLEQLSNIQRAATRSKEKLQFDISSRESQIGMLAAQNSEQMMLIDKLTGSLKLCALNRNGEQ